MAAAAMIARCKGCGHEEELICQGRHPCNKTWLARSHGWWVDQKKGCYCKECGQETNYYETDRTLKQGQAIGVSVGDSQICRSCRAAAIEIWDHETAAGAAPPSPQAAAAAGPEQTPDSPSSSDGSSGSPELRRWRRNANQEARRREASGAASPPTRPEAPRAPRRRQHVWATPPAKQLCKGGCGEIAPKHPECGCSRTLLARAMRWTGEKKKLWCPQCSADVGYAATPEDIQEARLGLCRRCKDTATRVLGHMTQ